MQYTAYYRAGGLSVLFIGEFGADKGFGATARVLWRCLHGTTQLSQTRATAVLTARRLRRGN